jgi:hypothetical protein
MMARRWTQFRKRFFAAVEKGDWHGWTGEATAAGRAWRTRIIYQTNLSTSYAAGRLAQLKDAGFQYWVYRHTPNEHPRLQHLAWDGLTLPADHPFWQTHFPPNGWGCKCRISGASGPETAELAGGKPGYTEPPDGWDAIDTKTGEQVGIDKGWGYMPGATSDLVREIERKMDSLPKPIARDLARDLGLAEQRPLGERLIRVGEQRGSVPGGLYEDRTTGERWYVKFYAEADQARSEWVAIALYRRLGLTTPDVEITTISGRTAIASRWMDGLRRATAEELSAHPDLPRLWQGAILTKDWDVLGLELDNVLIDPNGRLVKLDAGGAFGFRAQGATKSYDRAIDEVKSLRDPSRNRAAAQVFNARFAADVFAEADGIADIKALKRTQVLQMCRQAGLPEADAKELTATLWARREALIMRYGEADMDAVPMANPSLNTSSSGACIRLGGFDECLYDKTRELRSCCDLGSLPVLGVVAHFGEYHGRDIVTAIPELFPSAYSIEPGALTRERRHRQQRLVARPELVLEFFRFGV